MSRAVTTIYICDQCGLTEQSTPVGWMTLEATEQDAPMRVFDFCPACKTEVKTAFTNEEPS
jgi:hypothetical protein